MRLSIWILFTWFLLIWGQDEIMRHFRPRDGGWTNFTYSWGPCTVTCGRGIQSGQAHRTCTNPSPSKDGKPCVGSHERKASRDCNTQPCPVDGQWSEYGSFSEWSECSLSCGVGKGTEQRFRKRNCNNPAPQYGGKSCPGSNVHAERRQCDLNPCPVDGGWSEFVPYGDWSQCSLTCNNGTQTRVRIRTCSEPAPLYGGKPCTGRSTRIEQRQCIKAECPVNGAWSVFGAFNDWSECSETCGEGNQERSRYRVCNNPSPKHGGKECKGSRIVNERRKCNTQPCPVHGGWSEFSSYSEWSTCPVTCGGGNQTRSRTRTCDNPLPKHKGFNCTGSVEESVSRKCNSNFCPVDGGWSAFIPFGVWSQCSASCNNGTRTRFITRTCSQPAPLYGGLPCKGKSFASESLPCNTDLCKVNGAWSAFGAFSDWSECSETCGEGNQERSRYRVCNNPSPTHGGKACKGSRILNERRKCNTQPCPVHGGWSEFSSYSEWSTCPVTCGGGNQKRSRTRKCDNPLPNHNGFNCTGSVKEIASRICNSNFCPVDGGWSAFIPYGVWSPCSNSCNNGTRTRFIIRTCSQPAPLYGGLPCKGKSFASETQPCNTYLCEGTKQTSNQTVVIIAVVLSILTILIFSTVSTLCQRRKICKSEQPVEIQKRDEVYEEIRNIGLRSHDYVPSYTEYVLNPRFLNRPEHGTELSSVLLDLRRHVPILNTNLIDGRPSTICIQEINEENEESVLESRDTNIQDDMNDQTLAIREVNQNENDNGGAEIYFDVANTQGNGISNVNGYEEPTVKTRNSYIVILPNVTDLEGVSEDHCDSIASYENNEPGKGEDMDSEFPLNLAKHMGENCNSRRHPISADNLDRNKIRVLQSDYDESDDERESAEYIKPLRVRPHSYVTVLPMIEVHNADICND